MHVLYLFRTHSMCHLSLQLLLTKPNKTNQQSSNITPVSTLMPPPKTPVRDEPNISSVLTTPPPVGKVRQL